ncbi:hypothetical protein SCHPADRAFT_886288 [Schizopora paradoxa]|uniref:Ubiquitin-like domain-containing protein n=1 Tax=Schizopora paradoxa TaxID=27342 RepID=A0A0H2S279_9AGAM|nr:hypothetical protein SCHPADRAFT_886288 [Schizopora paradoxa]
MSGKIRNIAIIHVKTLTGNTIDVELDLDDGEWRKQEADSQQNATDAEVVEDVQSREERNDNTMTNLGEVESVDTNDSNSSAVAMETNENDSAKKKKKAMVPDLKERIFEVQGIPPKQQRLVFRGKQLTDEDELDKLGVKEETVHLVLALRGGCL